MNIKTFTFRVAAVACALSLAGCAAGPKPIYQWGSYQAQVYEHFKGQTAPEAQIQALEADLRKMQETGTKAPPGFHAHLGMLYASAAQPEAARKALNTEKTLFPEGATYVDFLLAKLNK
jgi:hypothetical protein